MVRLYFIGFIFICLFQSIWAMERALFKKEVPLQVSEIIINEDESKDSESNQDITELSLKNESQVLVQDAKKSPIVRQDTAELTLQSGINKSESSTSLIIQNIPYPLDKTPSITEYRGPMVLTESFSQTYEEKPDRIYHINDLLSWVGLAHGEDYKFDVSLLRKVLEKMSVEFYNKMIKSLGILEAENMKINEKDRLGLLEKMIEFLDTKETQEHNDILDMQENKQKMEIQSNRRFLAAKIAGCSAGLCALWAAVATYFAATQ